MSTSLGVPDARHTGAVSSCERCEPRRNVFDGDDNDMIQVVRRHAVRSSISHPRSPQRRPGRPPRPEPYRHTWTGPCAVSHSANHPWSPNEASVSERKMVVRRRNHIQSPFTARRRARTKIRALGVDSPRGHRLGCSPSALRPPRTRSGQILAALEGTS